MLIDSKHDLTYWAEAIQTANYLRNRSPTKAVKNITPEEKWSKTKPDLSHIRLFGYNVMAHIPKQLRKKWDSKSKPFILTGYFEENSRAYRIVDPKTGKLHKVRDCIFLENKYLGKNEPNKNLILIQ